MKLMSSILLILISLFINLKGLAQQSGIATYVLDLSFADFRASDPQSQAMLQKFIKRKSEVHEIWYNDSVKLSLHSPVNFKRDDYHYKLGTENYIHDSRQYNEGRFEFLRKKDKQSFIKFTGKRKSINDWSCYEFLYNDKYGKRLAWATPQLPMNAGWIEIANLKMAVVELVDENVNVRIVKHTTKPIKELAHILKNSNIKGVFDLSKIDYIDLDVNTIEIRSYLKKYKRIYQFFWDGELSILRDTGIYSLKNQIKEFRAYLLTVAKKNPNIMIQVINTSDEDYFVLKEIRNNVKNYIQLRGGAKLFRKKKLNVIPCLVSIDQQMRQKVKVIHSTKEIDDCLENR